MRRLFDFLSAATSSVLMSFAAIEGVANALIDNLPRDVDHDRSTWRA